ncbi:MAG: tRNA (adenosine(37)-N6)-threonylcarbamoyltransferase complex dimerization subunit type 1 TsaB [Bacteroidales bacterium]|nr:tRNA (adenosine(37)-N6)-threonylcarbamoyltransferase complex dimerization subunit type 1 TsaB [Bacteroidales bacterium]HPO65056.1 tRNA (adenosine(37)-N6)-threonylcarbamoyltransferase complex dimerization subunit type 1 TsaB [Bacteroidales bacterium]
MMPKILAIETSEHYCSVAFFEGTTVLLQLIDSTERNHSQMLTVLINKLLEQLNLSVNLIDAVAISKGPGSYTGLRIGTSVAKGLCYALEKPLIAVSTLELMCYAALAAADRQKVVLDSSILCPMIDARRMEVYTQLFDVTLTPISSIEAKIISSETFTEILADRKLILFGSGADKVAFLYNNPNAVFLKDVRPMAEFMAQPAYDAYKQQRFENVAYFEPFYLKNFVATRATKKWLGDR